MIRILDRSIDKILAGMGVAAIVMMLVLAAFIVAQVFSRYILSTHVLGLFDLSVYCLIAFTFLIPAYTLAKGEHVTVDVLVFQFPETIRSSLDIGVYLVSFLFPLLLGWYGWQWAHDSFSRGVSTVAGLPIPKGILISTIPAGCIFLCLQLIRIVVKKITLTYGYVRRQGVSGKGIKDNPLIAPLIFVIGIIICLAVLNHINPMVGLAILVLVLLFSGMPVFMALGLSGAAGLYLLIDPATMPQIATMAYKAVDKFSLTCLPLFILAGIIFERGKVLDKVFLLLELFTGRFASASLVTTVLIGGFFCAVTGSSVGATGAIAAVMLPLLIGRGYSKSLSTGTIAGSTIGLIIPPSMAYILYGVITGESIAQLFMAGIGPGALLFAFYIAYIVIRGVVKKGSLFENGVVPRHTAFEKTSWNKRIGALKMASWGLFTPIFVLGGIYLGVFTPTEAAAVMVVYAIVVCVFIMRTLSWRDVIGSSLRGAEISSMILCIIAGAMILGAVISQLRIAVNLASFAHQAGLSTEAVLAFIFLALFILGMFLDGASIMVITLPIFYPLAMAVGVNSVWFGVFYTLSIEIGLLTPPVGLNLFVIKGVSGLPLTTVIKGTAPFLFIMAMSLLIMYCYPQLVLWLPSTMVR